MGTALAVFLGMVGVTALMIGLVVAWAVHGVVCANRVSPTTAGTAPLTWLGSPVTCARLHRRLRRAVDCAQAAVGALPAGPAHDELESVAVELEQRAATLDRHLVVAHRAPVAERRARTRACTLDVVAVESMAGRLAAWSAQRATPTGVADLAARLDALDAAHRELSL
jgi:hypothetical protein